MNAKSSDLARERRAADRSTEARLLALLRQRVDDRRRHPIDHIAWLPLQRRFLSDPSRFKLIRAGNQTIGKTTPMLAEVVGRCRGVHPSGVPVPRPPIEAWIVCASWQQSLGIQEKLAALLPWDELDPRTAWSVEAGFTPLKSPVVKFRNGSLIRIKTTSQDAISFAGATIDVVGFDEPPANARLLTEAVKRLEDRGGVLLLSLTPINAPAESLEHLRKLCASGKIMDHWEQLTPASLIPEGHEHPICTGDGRPKDAAWIAQLSELCEEHEIPIVVHGAWEGGSSDRYFARWVSSGPGAHVRADLPPAPSLICALGVDHGDRPGKQVAVLILIDETDPEAPQVCIVDEYTDPTGLATPADDARGILEMLRRNDLRWDELDYAHGDRVHMPGSAQQKSNKDLAAQVTKQLKAAGAPLPRGLVPMLETVKRGENRRGSLSVGQRYLTTLVNRGRLRVHPRCERVIAAFEHYMGKDDDWKDPIDAVRYALDPWIFGERNRRPLTATTVRMY